MNNFYKEFDQVTYDFATPSPGEFVVRALEQFIHGVRLYCTFIHIHQVVAPAPNSITISPLLCNRLKIIK